MADCVACGDDAAASAGQLAPAPFYRPRSARIQARCDAKRLTFTCVLYGAADERARERYASKIADNIPHLLRKYEGCSVVIYFNETTPRAFLERMRKITGRVKLVYFKERTPSHNIMYARFLAFDEPTADWVFTIDPQEELSALAHNYDRLVASALSTDGLQLAALWWPEKTSGARMFPSRKPPRVLDAGAFGVCKEYRSLKKLEPLVREYMRKFQYGYGLDEVLLEAWVGVEYPKWFEEDGGKGFIVTQGDPESDMALGNVEIVDPAMVGSDASTFAHDIVDFSDVIPGSQPHPAVAHYANKARFRSEPPAAKTTKKRKAATASPQTVVEDELVATDGLLEEGKQGGWHG